MPSWVRLSIAWIVLVMVVLVMVSKAVVSWFQLDLSWRLIAMTIVWTLLIGLWWLAITREKWPEIKVKSINKWMAPEASKDPLELWREYGEYGALKHRVLRAFGHTLVYLAFASVIFNVLEPGEVPCRGVGCAVVDHVIILISVLSMLLLLFLVVDATRLCISLIERLEDPDLEWSESNKAALPILPNRHQWVWMRIHLIGERTAEVTRLIYYPVLIILLLLLSRSTYFDNWGFPEALGVIVGLNFIIALASAIRLNQAARWARSKMIDELRKEQLTQTASEHMPKPTGPEVRELIEQLEKLHIGAYLRLWDQPTVRATLLLVGGIAITYSEYLSMF